MWIVCGKLWITVDYCVLSIMHYKKKFPGSNRFKRNGDEHKIVLQTTDEDLILFTH